MSKYLMVVDLPDDSRCRGCPLFNEEQSTCPEMEELIDMNVWGNPLNWNRNKNNDCPLIPVDRVMDRLYGLCQSQGDAGYRAVGILQDELGVTE